MDPATTRTLPEYEHPPVSEVAFGALFQPVAGLVLPHLGAFWATLTKEFPRAEEAPPLLPLVEVFGSEPATIDLGLSDLPLPRIWLVQADGRGLVQLQKNRFHFNWRKQEEGDEYPRFPAVSARFFELFDLYSNFLESQGLSGPDPIQYELSYINTIPLSEDLEMNLAVHQILRDFEWSAGERFLPSADQFSWELGFAFPDQSGRLHCIARTGRFRLTGKPVLSLELTARGMPTEAGLDDMRQWFDVAHEWVVHGFTDLTTPEAQDAKWSRIR